MASVTFKGNPVNLLGNNVEVGAAAPSVTLKAGDLSDITIGGANNKAQIILTMPSLSIPYHFAKPRYSCMRYAGERF